MKAMILAAGMGTRMLPLTSNMPKALIKVQGIPLLEHTIRFLKFHGVNEVVINLHHYGDQIIDFIRSNHSFGIHIEFSDEKDELLDTGGGLYQARWFFNNLEPFILTSSDVITDLNLEEMMAFHKQKTPLVTLAVKHRNSTRDFIFDKDNQLLGWHNNLTGETKLVREADEYAKAAFSTIHIIDPQIFGLITERRKFSIIDLYLRLATNYGITGFLHDDSQWFECGKIANLENLNQSAAIKEIIEKYK